MLYIKGTVYTYFRPAFSLRRFLKKNPDIQISIQNSGDQIKAGAIHHESRTSTRLNPSGKRQGSERERTSVSKYSQVLIPRLPQKTIQKHSLSWLCVSGGWHVNLEGVNVKPVAITWFIPEDHLQNLKKRQMHVLFDVRIKIFSWFFLMTVSTNDSYFMNFCFLSHWIINLPLILQMRNFLPLGKPRNSPSRYPARAHPENMDAHSWISRVYWKINRILQ